MTNILTTEVVQKFLQKAPELQKYAEKTKLVLEPTYQPPFEYLLKSIIYQQLSGKAASTIYQRFKELVGEISPVKLLDYQEDELRAVGLSRQKAGYVLNVAREFQPEGSLAKYDHYTKLEKMKNDEIIQLFTKIKGVGEWTVQMYLIFGLGRLNVFAAKDLGIRNGIALMYEIDQTPTPGQAKKLTQHWNDHATVGSILSWRIQD